MDTVEEKQRDDVVAEARSWLRTPFHHAARIKGVGVDCAMLPAAVYAQVGLIPYMENVDYYPLDWHLHRNEERYLATVLAHAKPTENPQKGDFALFQFGRCFSHGAIVTDWPNVIHAYIGQGVILGRADLEPLVTRKVKFFTLWG
jgi:cell wall-associated NlpC family hydrolase